MSLDKPKLKDTPAQQQTSIRKYLDLFNSSALAVFLLTVNTSVHAWELPPNSVSSIDDLFNSDKQFK